MTPHDPGTIHYSLGRLWLFLLLVQANLPLSEDISIQASLSSGLLKPLQNDKTLNIRDSLLVTSLMLELFCSYIHNSASCQLWAISVNSATLRHRLTGVAQQKFSLKWETTISSLFSHKISQSPRFCYYSNGNAPISFPHQPRCPPPRLALCAY